MERKRKHPRCLNGALIEQISGRRGRGGEQLMVLSSAQVRTVSGGRAPQASRSSGYTGTYRLLVRGKNINQNTLLATDYLNHFNEIIMLLEMLPSMPECYGDAAERSEENPSDLQSLMRTSYAVLC